MTPLQEPPFAIQIEPTEGCTLACSFCGLQSIRDNGADAVLGIHGSIKGPYKFMTVSTAEAIASSIASAKWNPRIEFAMHGEPTVNSSLTDIVSVFRHHLPKVSLMVTSNGSGVMSQARIDALFYAGLNTLALDDYAHARFVPKVPIADKYPVLRYPADKTASPHTRFFGKRIVIIADIADTSTGTHQLTNQGGNSVPDSGELPLQQRCAKPFRELSIRWDGNVALCCDDWKGKYRVGNVLDMHIEELWNHERFQVARRLLYAADRGSLAPCDECNVRTYRNGLLPDKKGQQHIAAPSVGDKEFARKMRGGKVFSIIPVKS